LLGNIGRPANLLKGARAAILHLEDGAGAALKLGLVPYRGAARSGALGRGKAGEPN